MNDNVKNFPTSDATLDRVFEIFGQMTDAIERMKRLPPDALSRVIFGLGYHHPDAVQMIEDIISELRKTQVAIQNTKAALG